MKAWCAGKPVLANLVPRPAQWSGTPWIPLSFVAILVLGGPLGEEPGWRGFALPRLLGRMNALAASLVLGILWVVWHLPLFWLEGSSQAGGSIPLFAGAVCAFSFLFTWAYLKTGSNLFAAVLFHSGINTASVVSGALFSTVEADRTFNAAYLGVLGATVAGLVLFDRHLFLRRQTP